MPANSFVGTWRLVSLESRTAGGEVSYPYGKDPAGCLLYGENGHLALTIMAAKRPKFASADLRGGSAEEKAAAFDAYLTYCGTYEVKGDAVIHHIELCLFPNWIGTAQQRFFLFSGDRLILRTPLVPVGGVEGRIEVVWQRVSRK